MQPVPQPISRGYKTISHCRACGSHLLEHLFSIGNQSVSDFVPLEKVHAGNQVPISLVRCERCTLIQQLHTAPQEFLYTRHYWYRSGTTDTMKRELADITKEASRYVDLEVGHIVLDIGCFPKADVIVEGFKPKDIKEIEVGERVLDKDGTFIKVLNKFEKEFTGELVTINLRGECGENIKCTPNHPILRVKVPKGSLAKNDFQQRSYHSNQEWVRADEIVKGDYCVMPRTYWNVNKSSIDLSDFVECSVTDKYIYALQTDKGGRTVKARNQTPLPRHIELTKEFGRLLGYYIAEGSGDSNGAFGFAFSSRETIYVADVTILLKDILGLNCSTRSNHAGAVTQIRCMSRIGKLLFSKLVGTNAHNKCLPHWIFNSPIEFKYGLIDGMIRGDGSVTGDIIKYDTVSYILARQVKFLLKIFGVNSSIVPNKPNGFGKENGKTLWSVRIQDNDSKNIMRTILEEESYNITTSNKTNNKWPTNGLHTLVRVDKVSREKYSGKVYNIETESGSYVVNSIVVHNSNDGTLLRSYTQSGIVRVGIEPATNLQEEGKQGIDLLVNDFWDGYKYYEALMNSPFQDISRTGSCKPRVITACGMMYDLDDPNPFIRDIAHYLHPDGVFIAQLMCAKQMYNLRDIGNLCHEHLEFYTLESLKQLFHKYGLKIVEIQENKVNGGSYRLFVRHLHASVSSYRQDQIDCYLEEESKYIHHRSRWIQWADNINKNLTNVYNFILGEKLKGKRTYVIGASTNGNVILQAMGLSNTEIDGASERSWEKCGLYTISSGIPINSEVDVRRQKPDYLLVLPYFFLQEIMSREMELRNKGTKFIVPIPEFRVI